MIRKDLRALDKASQVEKKINKIIAKDISYFKLLLREPMWAYIETSYLSLYYIYCDSDISVEEEFFLTGPAASGISLDNIFTQIAKNTTIKELELKFRSLSATPRSYQNVPYMLQENHTLTHLHFDNAQITDTDVKYLCQGLLVNKTVKRLVLNNNNLSENGARDLLNTILCVPSFSLECLELRDNHISEGLLWAINHIVWSNRSVRQKNEGQTVCVEPFGTCQPPTIRCYALSVRQLDSLLEDSLATGRLQGMTSVIIYNTPINIAFLAKWFKKDRIGANLETLALFDCDSPSPTEFFFHPDRAGNFPKLKILNLTR